MTPVRRHDLLTPCCSFLHAPAAAQTPSRSSACSPLPTCPPRQQLSGQAHAPCWPRCPRPLTQRSCRGTAGRSACAASLSQLLLRPPRDSAFLELSLSQALLRSHRPRPARNGAPAGAQCAASAPQAATRVVITSGIPVKDRRHSKWKNFGRGGFSCESARCQRQLSRMCEPQDSPPNPAT